MKIELVLNHFDWEWWFEIGMGYQTTPYHEKRHVFSVYLLFATLYVRWGSHK